VPGNGRFNVTNLGVALLIIYAIVVAGLVYGGFLTHSSHRFFNLFAPVAALILFRILMGFDVIKLPARLTVGLAKFIPSVEFVRAAACFVAAMLWVVVGTRFVSDTPLGATILFVPPVLLVIAMGLFVGRGLMGRMVNRN